MEDSEVAICVIVFIFLLCRQSENECRYRINALATGIVIFCLNMRFTLYAKPSTT